MTKLITCIIAVVALGCADASAMMYMYGGVAYNTPEEMLAAQEKAFQTAEAAILRFSAPVSQKRLLVITPSLNMVFAVKEMMLKANNGRELTGEERTMHFNLAKTEYALVGHRATVLKLSGIYKGYDFQEQTAFQFSPPEPDNSRDILWLRQPESWKEIAQWIYIDSRNGRQVILFDITGATHQEHDRAFLDVIKGKAIRQ